MRLQADHRLVTADRIVVGRQRGDGHACGSCLFPDS
jgi:hypothetical protein